MRKKTGLTSAAETIGAAVGRISGKTKKAKKVAGVAAKELLALRRRGQKEAVVEFRRLSKMMDRMKRDLEKANKRLMQSMR
jgi:hypothetical protein